MRITETDNKFLKVLVQDSIIYNLSVAESLEYIKTRFRPISIASYKQRKARALSEDTTQVWLNYFTRIGFVKHHKEQIEYIQKLQDDSLRQFFIESLRTSRSEDLILKLKQDIRDNTKLLSELGLGTPIISAIKAKLEERPKIEERDAKTVQASQ